MRHFDYTVMPKGLLTVETMNLVAALHERCIFPFARMSWML